MLKKAAIENVNQLKKLVKTIDKTSYTLNINILSGASIGQHIRHILEFYLLLVSETKSGILSYDKRERDIRIENNLEFAHNTIEAILEIIETLNLSDLIKIQADFSNNGINAGLINSSVGRELAYCVEHSIHHQALIKAGLISLELNDLTDNNFGVAYSTIRYRKELCVQ